MNESINFQKKALDRAKKKLTEDQIIRRTIANSGLFLEGGLIGRKKPSGGNIIIRIAFDLEDLIDTLTSTYSCYRPGIPNRSHKLIPNGRPVEQISSNFLRDFKFLKPYFHKYGGITNHKIENMITELEEWRSKTLAGLVRHRIDGKSVNFGESEELINKEPLARRFLKDLIRVMPPDTPPNRLPIWVNIILLSLKEPEKSPNTLKDWVTELILEK